MPPDSPDACCIFSEVSVELCTCCCKVEAGRGVTTIRMRPASLGIMSKWQRKRFLYPFSHMAGGDPSAHVPVSRLNETGGLTAMYTLHSFSAPAACGGGPEGVVSARRCFSPLISFTNGTGRLGSTGQRLGRLSTTYCTRRKCYGLIRRGMGSAA